MRFKIFLLTCAASSLFGCANPEINLPVPPPEFPSGTMCTLVWKESLEKSYGYCGPWDKPTEFKRIPIEEIIKGKYMGLTPEFGADIMAWKANMEGYTSEHCGK